MTPVRRALQGAPVEDKAEIHGHMGLRLTYEPGKHNVRVEINFEFAFKDAKRRAFLSSQTTLTLPFGDQG